MHRFTAPVSIEIAAAKLLYHLTFFIDSIIWRWLEKVKNLYFVTVAVTERGHLIISNYPAQPPRQLYSKDYCSSIRISKREV